MNVGTIITSVKGEGGLNEAEQEYISFIVKIANWNVSIHNLPEFDRERAFHDWFSLMIPISDLLNLRPVSFPKPRM
jgi:hypothetical protein